MTQLRRACLLLLLPLSGLAGAGCVAPGMNEIELTPEQACLAHFENDPVEQDRCRLDARSRSGTVPDVPPMSLPIRSGTMGD
jgi:hypothetical protein